MRFIIGTRNTVTDGIGALIAPHEAALDGAVLGSRLTIPTGFAGVVVKDGKLLDTLAAGEHFLESALLPGLIQKVKQRFGIGQGLEGAAPFPSAVFLVTVARPVSLPWRTGLFAPAAASKLRRMDTAISIVPSA